MSDADFQMIRPTDVTDSMVTNNSIPETVAATYSSGTTYAIGAWVGLAAVYGSGQLVYESLSSGNVGHALPVPPATTTAYWKYVGTVYPAYASGSSCGEGGIVTSGHSLYESLVAGNTGNALTDTLKWLPIGSTNAWKCFDSTYGSQTEGTDKIEITIVPGTSINSVFIGNVEGSYVLIEQPGSGFSQQQSLASHKVDNWYNWYYDLVETTSDVVFTIPPYPTSEIKITIFNTGNTVKCGLIYLGNSYVLGITQWGINASILSFSGTTTDTFGNTTFLKRQSAKKVNVTVTVRSNFTDVATGLLTRYIDTPLVFVGTTKLSTSMVYGYLGDWDLSVDLGFSTAKIEIKGLV